MRQQRRGRPRRKRPLALSRGKSAQLEPWDWRYYAEKVRQVRYELDEATVKPYFALHRMVEAVFDCAQRLFGLYRGLARRHDVQVLCVVPNRNTGARDEKIERVALARRKAWYTSLAWRLERARLAPLFLAVHAHRFRRRRLLAELTGTPDVLMADLHLSGLFESSGARLRVLHAHNVEFDHFRTAGPGISSAEAWANRLRAIEERAAGMADLVVVASEEDATRFRTLYGVTDDRLVIAPNGYDEREAHPAFVLGLPPGMHQRDPRERDGVLDHGWRRTDGGRLEVLFVNDVGHARVLRTDALPLLRTQRADRRRGRNCNRRRPRRR